MGTGSHQGFGPGFATHAPAEGPGLEARHGWQECEPFPDFPALPDPEQGMGTPEGDQAGDKGHKFPSPRSLPPVQGVDLVRQVVAVMTIGMLPILAPGQVWGKGPSASPCFLDPFSRDGLGAEEFPSGMEEGYSLRQKYQAQPKPL